MSDLAGRTAVVTGGASGIGRALAERFVAEGMRLVLADVEEDVLAATAAALGAQGEVLAVPTDVTDPAAVDRLRDATLERFGTPFVVCNNAGVGGLGGFVWEGPLAAWEWVLGVNLFGVLHGIRAFVPLMVEADEGHVVNTGSLASLQAAPGMGPYCASKHAVLGMSESLHHELELSGSKVQVHVLAPGFLRTGIHDSDRNWLDRFGPRPAENTDEMSQAFRKIVADLVEGGLPPEQLAEALIDAMCEGRFFVTTHPEAATTYVDTRSQTVTGANPVMTDFS
jgi:NAD(P)-dependent dehydrogenase (short-subunit alcohol dehydrogenase family)